MTTNARIRDIATGVTAEMIAEQTHLFYDPTSKTGYASFQAREHLVVNDVVGLPMGDYNILRVDLAAIATTKFGAGLVDSVSGLDLSQLTVAGLDTYIKAAYDQLFNANAQAAAAAAAEAPAEQPAP